MSDTSWDLEEHDEYAGALSRNDRFSSVLVILITLTALGLGLVLRQRTFTQTWFYASREAGIEAYYPAGWLTDESSNYVVQMRDPKARPFKTRYVITVVPAGGETSVRNILDTLTIQRSADLPAYRVLSIEEVSVGGSNLTQMDFAFVDADPNPFIQRLPVVVLGMDIVIIDGNRAIIVTYMDDQNSFNDNLPTFERFLASLRY